MLISSNNMFVGHVNEHRKQLDRAIIMQADAARRVKAASIGGRGKYHIMKLEADIEVAERRRALNNAVKQLNERQAQLGDKDIKTPRSGQMLHCARPS